MAIQMRKFKCFTEGSKRHHCRHHPPNLYSSYKKSKNSSLAFNIILCHLGAATWAWTKSVFGAKQSVPLADVAVSASLKTGKWITTTKTMHTSPKTKAGTFQWSWTLLFLLYYFRIEDVIQLLKSDYTSSLWLHRIYFVVATAEQSLMLTRGNPGTQLKLLLCQGHVFTS